jgi:hypothetical protein
MCVKSRRTKETRERFYRKEENEREIGKGNNERIKERQI